MRNVALSILALFIGGVASSEATAQPLEKSPVVVERSGKDIIGERIAFALREEFRRSGFATLSSGSTMPDGYRVLINSLGIENGSLSAFSVTLVRHIPSQPFRVVDGKMVSAGSIERNEYVLSNIGFCGQDRTEACARAAYEVVGQAIESRRALSQEITDAFRAATKPND